MDNQFRPLAEVPVVSLVQVAPPSVEVQMSPPATAAASLVPSEEEVMITSSDRSQRCPWCHSSTWRRSRWRSRCRRDRRPPPGGCRPRRR